MNLCRANIPIFSTYNDWKLTYKGLKCIIYKSEAIPQLE